VITQRLALQAPVPFETTQALPQKPQFCVELVVSVSQN
jgi:hypothetical protein